MLLHSHLAFFEGLSTCCRAFNSYLYGALYNFSVYWSCWGKKCLIEMAIKCLLQLFFYIKYYFFNYILQLRSMTSFSTVVGGRVNFEGNSGNGSGLFATGKCQGIQIQEQRWTKQDNSGNRQIHFLLLHDCLFLLLLRLSLSHQFFKMKIQVALLVQLLTSLCTKKMIFLLQGLVLFFQ